MKEKIVRHATLLTCLISVLFFACKQETNKNTIEGVWESVGYGRIVKIEDGEYILADVTEISCIPLMEGEISEFGEALQFRQDTLSLKTGINTYYFTRLEDAPLICKSESNEYKEAQARKDDPENNFEVLWSTFKNHYAYFELRDVDPEKMYAEYRPRVSSETTKSELFLILYQMLESFDDGHIDISAPEEIENEAERLYVAEHVEENTENEDTSSEPKERLRNYEIATAVAEKYIPEGKSRNNGNLRWGMLENEVGYLQVNQMVAMADYGISDTLSYSDYWKAYFEKAEESDNSTLDELNGITASLDSIMKYFSNTRALIIDVRFNGGGMDEVGMAILERFNNAEKIVFTKKGRHGEGFTPVNQVMQTASDDPYEKPVYLLIGPESASATEIMTLSSLSLPNIRRIGSRTEGVFSDILEKTLPNGWEFGLSNEIYLDMEGNNYEGKGIPPDIELNYSRDTQNFLKTILEDLENGGDKAIEKALEVIE